MHDDATRVAWWRRPPGRPLAVATALIGAVWLYAESKPGGDLFIELAVLAAVAIIALTWAVRTITALGHDKRWSYRFVVAPLIGALTVAAIALDLPFQARWSLAEDDFERAAVGVLAGTVPLHEDLRIGGLRVSPSVAGGTARFMVWGAGGIMDIHYLVYAPEGTTVRTYGEHPDSDSIEHIDGRWWHVMEIF